MFNGRVILISGKAGHGKDTLGAFLNKILSEKNYKVTTCHYADLLKFYATQYCGWDGKKDYNGRTLLQFIGTDLIRKKDQNFWVNRLKEVSDMLLQDNDFIIIPDVRFENEILEWDKDKRISIRVSRIEYDSNLNETQKNHSSETSLDNFDFDYYIEAKNLKELKECANILVDKILIGE